MVRLATPSVLMAVEPVLVKTMPCTDKFAFNVEVVAALSVLMLKVATSEAPGADPGLPPVPSEAVSQLLTAVQRVLGLAPPSQYRVAA
jgi:hypothetical protein